MYMVRPLLASAVTILYFRVVTVSCSGLNLGVSLFFFCCRQMTVSPLMSDSWTVFLVVVHFVVLFLVSMFSFAILCLLRTFLHSNSGRCPWIGLLNSNTQGAIFVIAWGVERWVKRNRWSSCLQFFPSTCAVFNSFPSGFMKLSALAFPWGQSRVLVCHSMPRTCMYRSYSWPLMGGPLSVLIVSGMPWVENILSSFGIHTLASVELTISTSGNF